MTHHDVLFIVGEPGVGKTALVRELLGPSTDVQKYPKGVKVTTAGATLAIGSYTGQPFDGADTIPISGIKPTVEWWMGYIVRCTRPTLTIFDGDKFSNAKVVGWVRKALEELDSIHSWPMCVYLNAPSDVVAARRAARGTTQNASWVKGRATKSIRFFYSFPESSRIPLINTCPVAPLAESVRSFVAWGRSAV